jgi:hypothetical protein
LSDGTIEASGILAQENGQDGIFIRTPVDALVNCSKINSNGDYGVDASGVLGALTFNDVLFDGLNISGDYSFSGTPVLETGGCATGGDPAEDPDAPGVGIIDLGGGGLFNLKCGELSGTGAMLSSGLMAVLDCPTVGDVDLRPAILGSLPGELPKGDQFIAGLDLSFPDGSYAKGTPGLIELAFPIPGGTPEESLVVLFWDGKDWIDLGDAYFTDGRMVYSGGYMSANGTFNTLANFTGLFVLVSR